MELANGIIENLEDILKGFLTLITIAMYITIIKKSKIMKFIILIFGLLSVVTLMILIAIKNSNQEIKYVLASSIIFCVMTFFGSKDTERLKEIESIIKEQKCFKKITYNIKGKKFSKKELNKIEDNLYKYFRFFEFNSYDANIGKLKIDIDKISNTIIQVDLEHTLSDESEIYYYDIVSRYESLKNSSFIDEVYLKYDNQFNNKIKLITKILTEE